LDSERQIKGRFYLTKIAHLLFPKNIPDIYQAGNSRDGTQTIDSERIAHSPGHALAMRGKDDSTGLLAKEVLDESLKINSNLKNSGLEVDSTLFNYTKNENGDIYYLESFQPWRNDRTTKFNLVLRFDQEKLRTAINKLDEGTREQCNNYLDRLLTLVEQEKRELEKKP